MLRTPTSAPWNQGGCGGEQEQEIKRLLPPPRANIAKQGLPRPDHWGELRAEVMSLLPTPAASEGGYNRSPSEGAAIRPGLDRLVRLLPTPVEGDSTNSRSSTVPRAADSRWEPGTTLSDVAHEWSGASTDQPSDAGSRFTDLRLSPSFVEWMIGAPDGWSDPDCPLSAMEFRSNLDGSSANTSSGCIEG